MAEKSETPEKINNMPTIENNQDVVDTIFPKHTKAINSKSERKMWQGPRIENQNKINGHLSDLMGDKNVEEWIATLTNVKTLDGNKHESWKKKGGDMEKC